MKQKNEFAIVFNMEKKNFYSLTPLIATLDISSYLNNLDILLHRNINPRDVKNFLTKYKKIIIAFSFRTAQIDQIYKKMKLFYENLNNDDLNRVIFIAGGSHSTGDPLTTLKLGFDFCFLGEAEISLQLFLEKFLQQQDIYSTPGIAYLNPSKNELFFNPNPPLIELDDYPFMSRERKLYPPLEITRGCLYGCTFCQVPNLFNHKLRHRSPDIIINTVKWMVKLRLNDIRFITSNSFGYMSQKATEINKDAILYLLSGIKSIKGVRSIYFGTFPGEVRPETVSEDLMYSIKPYIANRKISIGLQSGSNEVLKKIRRGHTVEEAISAINTVVDTGFTPIVDMIFGIPGATITDEQESINIIRKIIQKKVIIRAHIFMPLPGTKLENYPFQPIYPKIRHQLGKLSATGKIEGNWTNQEIYAKKAWETIQEIKSLPAISKLNTH